MVSGSKGMGSGESDWFIVGLSEGTTNPTFALIADCLRTGNLRGMDRSPGYEKGWLDPREVRFDRVIPLMLVS